MVGQTSDPLVCVPSTAATTTPRSSSILTATTSRPCFTQRRRRSPNSGLLLYESLPSGSTQGCLAWASAANDISRTLAPATARVPRRHRDAGADRHTPSLVSLRLTRSLRGFPAGSAQTEVALSAGSRRAHAA